MHLNANLTHLSLGTIVEATVVKDELHVLHELLYALVLLLFELPLYS